MTLVKQSLNQAAAVERSQSPTQGGPEFKAAVFGNEGSHRINEQEFC